MVRIQSASVVCLWAALVLASFAVVWTTTVAVEFAGTQKTPVTAGALILQVFQATLTQVMADFEAQLSTI